MGSWGHITMLTVIEEPPGSGQWMAVGMMPSYSTLQFKCILVDKDGKIVKWEKDGFNRKIDVQNSHLYISLPWGITDIYFFLQQPPKDSVNL